ncbi:MAG: OB-fold domain-containing protein [Tessaracoccus sp.]
MPRRWLQRREGDDPQATAPSTAGATWFVIDVHGVGYRATTTPAAAAALRPGEVSTVYTSMVVRQDSLSCSHS